MKLNYRDKVILGIFLAFLILVVGFFTLIKPKNAEIKADKKTLETKQAEQAEVKQKIAQIEPLQDTITETVDETNKITVKFVEKEKVENPKLLDEFMQHFADDNKIALTSLDVSDMTETTLGYYYMTVADIGSGLRQYVDIDGNLQEEADKEQAEQNQLSQRTQETVLQTRYGISAKATKEDLWNFVDAINKYDDTLKIESLSYSLSEDENNDNAAPETPPAEGEEGQPTTPQPTEETDTDQIDILPTDMVDITMVVSLYSVYDMPMPNIETAPAQ